RSFSMAVARLPAAAAARRALAVVAPPGLRAAGEERELAYPAAAKAAWGWPAPRGATASSARRQRAWPLRSRPLPVATAPAVLPGVAERPVAERAPAPVVLVVWRRVL